MVVGSEAYQAALVFYQSVKMAAAQDIPGAKAVYEELKTRFPQGSKRRNPSRKVQATRSPVSAKTLGFYSEGNGF
ncbi:MAG: hypothetical protein LBF75_02570 [Treponema sp.]|nr:hypothetical protein [Treponema sp.]